MIRIFRVNANKAISSMKCKNLQFQSVLFQLNNPDIIMLKFKSY